MPTHAIDGAWLHCYATPTLRIDRHLATAALLVAESRPDAEVGAYPTGGAR